MTDTSTATRTLVVEREITHSPETVWRALTESALLEDRLMRNDFRPVVGHKFNFRADPSPYWNGVTDCEVLISEPPRRLAYSWNPTGDDAAKGPKTVVTWTLAPTASGVLVRMEQSGFRPQDERNYQGATYGWQRFLTGLDRVVCTLE